METFVEIAVEIGKQVPALVVLGVIVRWFLVSMRERDQRYLEHETRREQRLTDTLSHIGDSCHEVQRDSIIVMRETKEELGAARQVSAELLDYLRRMKERAEA